MTYSPDDILLDKYRIEALIGQGAFGDVYRVVDLMLNKVYAIKVLRRDMPGVGSEDFQKTTERFGFEAKLGEELDHPNVIKVYKFFKETDGGLHLVMEYAPGGNLHDRLKDVGTLSVSDSVCLGMELSAGLDAIHNKLGVIHRDIKPANILFGENGVAKIADLGLAQGMDGDSRRSLLGSLAGRHPGTPLYMSPEQGNSSDQLLATSDIFSVGCVLFEALTGKGYKSPSVYGTRTRNHRADVPLWLDKIVARALAEQPGRMPKDDANKTKRYRNAHQLLNALKVGKSQSQTKQANQPIKIWSVIGLIGATLFLLLFLGLQPFINKSLTNHQPDLTKTIQTESNLSSSPTPEETIFFSPTPHTNIIPTLISAPNAAKTTSTSDPIAVLPLATVTPKSTISIDQQPTSTLEPVLSGNGKIVFLNGDLDKQDIYMIDANGNNLSRLTNTEEHLYDKWEPCGCGGTIGLEPQRLIANGADGFGFSRNGKFMFYYYGISTDRKMGIIDLSKKQIMLNNVNAYRSVVSWSMDGSMLAFTASEGTNKQILKILDTQSGKEIVIDEGSQFNKLEWLGNTSKLFFHKLICQEKLGPAWTKGEVVSTSCTSTYYATELSTTRTINLWGPLANSSDGFFLFPQISPDQKKLALGTASEVIIFDIATKKIAVQIKYPTNMIGIDRPKEPVWDKDNHLFIDYRPNKYSSSISYYYKIIDNSLEKIEKLSDLPKDIQSLHETNKIEPLIFAGQTQDGTDIYIGPWSYTNSKKVNGLIIKVKEINDLFGLQKIDIGGFALSPNKDKLLLALTGRTAQVYIVVYDILTNKSTLIFSKAGDFHHIRWSPDEKMLAFIQNFPTKDPELYTVNIDGTGLTKIAGTSRRDIVELFWVP